MRISPSLEQLAPFITDLPREEKEQIAATLAPYYDGQRKMEVQQQGPGHPHCLSVHGEIRADKTLILTLKKGKESPWVLQEQISYRQSFEFIPLERKRVGSSSGNKGKFVLL